jgi:hypothetical protein
MARAKLEWARVRLGELNADVQRVVRDANHLIYMRTRGRVFELFWQPPITPGEFGLRTGEIAHSLRSALDVLVWNLSKNPESIKRPQPAFPISDSEADYNGRGRLQVRGLEPYAQGIVRSYQPFDWVQGPPSTHPLHQLRELNNIDKHRIPHAVLTALELEIEPIRQLATGIRDRLDDEPEIIAEGHLVMPGETPAALGGIR